MNSEREIITRLFESASILKDIEDDDTVIRSEHHPINTSDRPNITEDKTLDEKTYTVGDTQYWKRGGKCYSWTASGGKVECSEDEYMKAISGGTNGSPKTTEPKDDKSETSNLEAGTKEIKAHGMWKATNFEDAIKELEEELPGRGTIYDFTNSYGGEYGKEATNTDKGYQVLLGPKASRNPDLVGRLKELGFESKDGKSWKVYTSKKSDAPTKPIEKSKPKADKYQSQSLVDRYGSHEFKYGDRVPSELRSNFTDWMSKRFPKEYKKMSSTPDFELVGTYDSNGKEVYRPQAVIWNKDNSRDYFNFTDKGWEYSGHKEY